MADLIPVLMADRGIHPTSRRFPALAIRAFRASQAAPLPPIAQLAPVTLIR